MNDLLTDLAQAAYVAIKKSPVAVGANGFILSHFRDDFWIESEIVFNGHKSGTLIRFFRGRPDEDPDAEYLCTFRSFNRWFSHPTKQGADEFEWVDQPSPVELMKLRLTI